MSDIQIELEKLDPAELVLVCKMTHIDVTVTIAAKDLLESLVGSSNSRRLQAEALKAYRNISALDDALYAEQAEAK